MKAILLDTALPSFKSFSNNRSQFDDLTHSKFKPLRYLTKNKNIVIQEEDKDNTTEILGKSSSISAIEEISYESF